MFSNTRIKKMMGELKQLKEATTDTDILALQNRIKTLESTNETLVTAQKELEVKVTALESKTIIPIK